MLSDTVTQCERTKTTAPEKKMSHKENATTGQVEPLVPKVALTHKLPLPNVCALLRFLAVVSRSVNNSRISSLLFGSIF